jgi:hypothetical protein
MVIGTVDIYLPTYLQKIFVENVCMMEIVGSRQGIVLFGASGVKW